MNQAELFKAVDLFLKERNDLPDWQKEIVKDIVWTHSKGGSINIVMPKKIGLKLSALAYIFERNWRIKNEQKII